MIPKFFFILIVTALWSLVDSVQAQSSQNSRKEPESTIQSIKLDETTLVLPCPSGIIHCGPYEPSQSFMIGVHLLIANTSKKTRFRYVVTRGKIVGEGRDVHWDLSNTPPGSYRIDVFGIKNGKELPNPQTASVFVINAVCICDCLSCPQTKLNATERKI